MSAITYREWFLHSDNRISSSSPPEATKLAKGSPLALLLGVLTNGLSDERIEKAQQVLDDSRLSANEKLTKLDSLIPIPATASGEQLGTMLGVKKQAVYKSDWWIHNRKGETTSEIGRRKNVHQKRAKEHELPSPKADDEG